MLSPIAILLIALYSVILVVSYYVVRRGWVRAYPAFVVSFVFNALVLFAFSLARGNSIFQALLVGLSMAAIFSGLSITIGAVFLKAAPLRKQAVAAQASKVATDPTQPHHFSA